MDRSNQVIKATTAIVMTIAMVGIVRAEKDNDAAVAPPPHANYVPQLPFIRRAPSASLDDIYWQLSKVTWADPSKAHTLKSEEERLAAEATSQKRR